MSALPGGTRWPLAVLLSGQLMVNVDLAIVNTAAPSIQHTLRAGDGELELVVSGYILAYAVLLITGARLGAIHGYRRLFLVGLVGFVLASLACGLAPGTGWLIAARVAQGAAAAMMVPQVLSGIQLTFTGGARTAAIGYYSLALSGGAVLGQLLGGVLVSADLFGTGWRPIFLINVPLGALLLAAAVRYLPRDDRARHREPLDLRGVAVLSLALLLAVVPLVFGREAGWPLWTWVSLVASIPALGWFVSTQRRTSNPLVNLSLVARPAVRWGLIAHGASTLTYLALLFVLAVYLQRGLGLSPAYSGFALVTWVAAFGVAGPLLPRLPAHLSHLMPALGCAILALGYLATSITAATGHASGGILLAVLAIGGFGLGLSSAALITHLTTATPTNHAADLSGIISTNAQLWGAIGVAAAGTAYLGLAHPPGNGTTAFTLITATFSALALAASGASLLATRAAGKHQQLESTDPRTAAEEAAT
ncbi:MFS transporter [Actinokineospora globicatena]|uniref:MFS transporter n=1 Tax=Actinokineospora globicatena TaxID=103729 RepID=UPI0020A2A538|nr:MFS transporter [Actinokineospora globicatena]MCP2306811.1 putative arabinose efflux permease, MFS family [Actinokineospora globicatena]GLW82064.1 MFS transporter [Actinokineospora globicatena]